MSNQKNRHPFFFVALCIASISASACLVEPQEESFAEEDNISETEEAITYNGHDYLFVVTPQDFNAARSYCQLTGYDLVAVNDAFEEQWLAKEQNQHGGGTWLLGFNDIGIENFWLWTNNDPTSYSNWAPGEPNNDQMSEDCVIDAWSNGQWNDVPCSNYRYKFICEKQSLSNSYTNYFDYTKTGTANATTNTENRSIQVYAGQVVTVGTCGLFGASVSSGDTWLRINSPNGQEIWSNDDSCQSASSNISFVALQTGTYTIRAGCFSSGSCSGRVAYKIGQ